PDDTLYPSSIADADYPRFTLSFPFYIEQSIDTLQGDTILSAREIMKFGGIQSLFRCSFDAQGATAAEVSVGAGLTTMFDTFEDALENFGWEGTGFLTFDLRVKNFLSFRFGFHHLSSHVGDEYLARYEVIALPLDDQANLLSGSTYGMDYVRDALYGGLSFQISPSFRFTTEVRYSMNMLRYMLRYNDFPWHTSLSFEYREPKKERETWRWYAAFHVSMYQESSWFPSTTIHAGRALSQKESNREFRVGFEYHYGRAQIASFNHTQTVVSWQELKRESHFAVGAWYDL
ncbi:MAG: DUF1207 domain-containing protein, partial [Sphaerochaetaceae bacterium]|nr:DUF1207 domain-containing protein [Sphaerochaetaceae bacterium]